MRSWYTTESPSGASARRSVAGLVEIYDAQPVGTLNLSTGRNCLSAQQPQQTGLSAAIGSDQSHPHSGGDHEIQAGKQIAAANLARDIFQFDQAFGLSIGGGEIDLRGAAPASGIQVREFADEFAGLVDPRLRFSRPRLSPTAQPLDFLVNQIFQGLLSLRLRMQEVLLLF